jgi:hypothetical protein
VRTRLAHRTALRLGGFAALLALVFGAAAAVGAAVDPGRPSASCAPAHDGMGHAVLGLGTTQGETRIAPAAFSATAGRREALHFRILGQGGAALTSGFQVEAQRRLHLIAVRRDLTGYQHLHPRMAADGTWSVPLAVAAPGAYRLFADFQRDCEKHVLAADLLVPGDFRPQALPPAVQSVASDGYAVRLHAPALHAGDEAMLTFSVSRAGQPATSLQAYLGARGHLVALRQGDLAYLHVHPEEHGDAANAVTFAADLLTPGNYRLFLQFRAGGTVHTAAFTARVAP